MSSHGTIIPGCETLPPMGPTAKRAPPQEEAPPPKGKGKARSRFGVINQFVDFSLAQVAPKSDAVVWLVLWRDTKPDGLARTSQADIARRTGMSLRTIKRATARLAKAGLITVVYRGGLSRGPSAYRVNAMCRPAQEGSEKDVG